MLAAFVNLCFICLFMVMQNLRLQVSISDDADENDLFLREGKSSVIALEEEL